ncbi:helix-turn-helix transcriptional regulator [Streptomyces sp. NPDC046374]|uniref:helix-turn-helix domain-containing protein n=1 Tax=Streptomyces sp. NPDC046374 TaxID=3154917 RepID=UPI0033C77CAD
MSNAPRLRDVRSGRGLTQSDVSTELKVSKQRVSALESAPMTSLQVGTLAAYAQALGGRLLIGIEVPGGVMVPVFWGDPIGSGTEL